MARNCPLPDPIIRLVLLYEGSVVKSYLICLLRRLNVRSYQAVLSREFNFYNLKYYSISHLAHLVHTELFSINRLAGQITTRVYRKAITPWLSLIHRLKMKKALHRIAVKLIYGRYRKGHPMYNTRTYINLLWLEASMGKIIRHRIR